MMPMSLREGKRREIPRTIRLVFRDFSFLSSLEMACCAPLSLTTLLLPNYQGLARYFGLQCPGLDPDSPLFGVVIKTWLFLPPKPPPYFFIGNGYLLGLLSPLFIGASIFLFAWLMTRRTAIGLFVEPAIFIQSAPSLPTKLITLLRGWLFAFV